MSGLEVSNINSIHLIPAEYPNVDVKDFIKCYYKQIETFNGRARVGFVKCLNPKCRRFISIYKDELNCDWANNKNRYFRTKCTCFKKYTFKLINWNK